MRWFLVSFVVLAGCSGNPKLGGPCQATCDCKDTTAPDKCAGEWVCNTSQTCEYTCKTPCAQGTVYTCRSEETCNGSICSERTGCSP